MPQTITIPRQVYRTLTTAFAAHEAESITRQIRDNPQNRDIMHLGDPFGSVFACIWDDDQDGAMLFLADYLTALRNHNPVADLNPPIRLDEVLRGLCLALPDGFGDYDQVVSKARRDVRGYYGYDPNA